MIEKYTKKLKDLLKQDVIIQCFKNKNYKSLEEHDLYYIKNLDNDGLDFRVLSLDDKIISVFKLIQMPGCCGICISTGTYVHRDFRGKGINSLLNNFRIDIAKELGYGILLCTDVKSNIPQLKTLDKNGWKHIYEFKNPRTENILNISIKKLTDEK